MQDVLDPTADEARVPPGIRTGVAPLDDQLLAPPRPASAAECAARGCTKLERVVSRLIELGYVTLALSRKGRVVCLVESGRPDSCAPPAPCGSDATQLPALRWQSRKGWPVAEGKFNFGGQHGPPLGNGNCQMRRQSRISVYAPLGPARSPCASMELGC